MPRPICRAAAAGERSRVSGAELAGKRMFLFPDSQLEIPLARFVSRELGMQVIEAGTPYLHRQHLAEELALLPQHRRARARGRTSNASSIAAEPRGLIWWFADWDWRIRWRPEGLTTKWSIELLFTPVQGYDQAGDLAELFARPLVRRMRLAV